MPSGKLSRVRGGVTPRPAAPAGSTSRAFSSPCEAVVRFRFRIPTLSILTCLLTLVPLGASAQTAADLFDRNGVQEIRLFINSRDLDQLRTKFREDIYYVVDFQWRNIRVRNAAVRSRGGV